MLSDKTPSGRGDVAEAESEDRDPGELKRKPKPRSTSRRPKKKIITELRQDTNV